jgi:hypothetical protein
MLFAHCSSNEADDGLIDELRRGFNDPALGVTDIFETVQQQVINRFDVFREQAHASALSSRRGAAADLRHAA